MSPSPADDMTTKPAVRSRCELKDLCLRCRRKTGKSPNTWIENNDKLNTAVVVRSRDANTVLAINAALVDNDDGNGAARRELGKGAADVFDESAVDAPGDVGSK